MWISSSHAHQENGVPEGNPTEEGGGADGVLNTGECAGEKWDGPLENRGINFITQFDW
jgi:hypothetical protein